MPPVMLRAKYIVVHHPASDNIALTLRDHIHPPFTDAPYDFWVEYPSGDVVKGRVLSKIGAHVQPDVPGKYANRPDAIRKINNRTAIGYAFEGNFDDERPPIGPSEAQIERGALHVAQTCEEYGIHPHDHRRPLEQIIAEGGVVPHLFVSDTVCPGRHFMAQWDAFIGKVRYYYNSLRG